jgi:hypothetical protein
MKPTGKPLFQYPSNIKELDLATLVSMYRKRGEPVEAPAGEYFGCALTHKVIRKAKWWFGLTYSQEAWDQLLSDQANGYPLTQIEFNILGLAKINRFEQDVDRSFFEANAGTVSQLAFMIINDLKQFGFLEGEGKDEIFITPMGEKALNGLARRIYDQPFTRNMLEVTPGGRPPQEKRNAPQKSEQESKAQSKREAKPAKKGSSTPDTQQASLF